MMLRIAVVWALVGGLSVSAAPPAHAATFDRVHSLPAGMEAVVADMSDDGRYVVLHGAVGQTWTTYVLDVWLNKRIELWTQTVGFAPIDAKISGDGTVVVGSLEGDLRFFHPVTGEDITPPGTPIAGVEDVWPSRDGNLVAYSYNNNPARIFDRTTGSDTELPGGTRDEFVGGISDDGRHVSVASSGRAFIIDRLQGRRTLVSDPTREVFGAPIISGDGRRVAHHSSNELLVGGDLQGRWPTLAAHPLGVSSNGRYLLIDNFDFLAGVDREIMVLDVEQGRSVTLAANTHPESGAISADGRTVVFVTDKAVTGPAGTHHVYVARISDDDFAPGPTAVKGTFVDDDGDVFEADIEWLVGSGITRGCNPPDNDRYCPALPVTRAQMASFLVRALGLPPGGESGFTDTARSVHVDDIDRLAAAGITRGCNPPDNDRYCPDQPVTRGQMATFLTRALGLPVGGSAGFVDTEASVHADDIDRLAAAGITRGCNPPDNDRYCPKEPVTRGQMAAFLHRAFPDH